MTQPPAEIHLTRAIHLVASRQLAAPTALQRWMGIRFREADALLAEMEQRGIVGPASGSNSRDVLVRHCEQCGRIGKRGFRSLANDEHHIQITVCANKTACRKRWPKSQTDEAA